jgi:hypothetical protein
MKKLVLAAAACILGFSLFICVQTASAAIGVPETYSDAWSADAGFTIGYDVNSIGENEEFGLYVWDPDVSIEAASKIALLDLDTSAGLVQVDSSLDGWKVSVFDLDDDETTFIGDLELGDTAIWGFYFSDVTGDVTNYYTSYDMTSTGYGFVLSTEGMTALVLSATPTPTPVPTAALLLGSGLVGLVGFRRRFGK